MNLYFISVVEAWQKVLARWVGSKSTEPAGWTLTSSIATEASKRISGKVQAPLIAVNLLGSNILAVAISWNLERKKYLYASTVKSS